MNSKFTEEELKKISLTLNRPMTRFLTQNMNVCSILGQKRKRNHEIPEIENPIRHNKVHKKPIVAAKRNVEFKVTKSSMPAEKKEKKPKKKIEEKCEKKSNFFIMNKYTKLFDEDCKDFLNGECSNSYCKYIHNFTKLWKDKNNEEFARRYYSLYQDFQVIAPYEHKILGKANLDLLFIMDCTGSMGGWLDACKYELKNIIDAIKKENPYSKINIGFVGYRDHSDVKRIISHPFTQNIEQLKEFIGLIEADGGRDFPEDITGGLEYSLSLEWKSDARYAILVCDAPCHGLKYHGEVGDDYENGCPRGLVLEDLIRQFAQKHIVFSAISIEAITDKMFSIMSKEYQEVTGCPIKISKLGNNTSDFGFVVASQASATLTSITIGNISLKEFLKDIQKDSVDPNTNMFIKRINSLLREENEQLIDIIEEDLQDDVELSIFMMKDPKIELKFEIPEQSTCLLDPNWNNLSNFQINSKCYSYSIPKDRLTYIDWRNPLIKESKINCTISIKETPFAKGAMRYAFYMKDLTLQQNLVGKLNQILLKSECTLQHLSKDTISIVTAQRIAYDFNNRIVNFLPDTRLLINFVNTYIYELKDYKGLPHINSSQNMCHQRFISVENYIDGEYSKFNNNSGWIDKRLNHSSQVAQAFSHFSWQITKGYLMIVDLQGVGGVLTDPQIHCIDSKKFGKGNLGYVGIMKFFLTHQCNDFCKKLELIHPKSKINIGSDYDFFVDKFVPPIEDKLINKICDICLKPYMASTKDLYDKKKKCWDSFCTQCELKRKSTFTEGKCVKCHWKFKSSAFIYQMRREEFPKTCQKCTTETRRSEIQDFQSKISLNEEL